MRGKEGRGEGEGRGGECEDGDECGGVEVEGCEGQER